MNSKWSPKRFFRIPLLSIWRGIYFCSYERDIKVLLMKIYFMRAYKQFYLNLSYYYKEFLICVKKCVKKSWETEKWNAFPKKWQCRPSFFENESKKIQCLAITRQDYGNEQLKLVLFLLFLRIRKTTLVVWLRLRSPIASLLLQKTFWSCSSWIS